MFINEQFGIYLIFIALICRSWNGQRRSARRNGIRQNKDDARTSAQKKTVEGAACGLVFSLILNAIAFVIYNKVADASLDAVGATILFGMLYSRFIYGYDGRFKRFRAETQFRR